MFGGQWRSFCNPLRYFFLRFMESRRSTCASLHYLKSIGQIPCLVLGFLIDMPCLPAVSFTSISVCCLTCLVLKCCRPDYAYPEKYFHYHLVYRWSKIVEYKKWFSYIKVTNIGCQSCVQCGVLMPRNKAAIQESHTSASPVDMRNVIDRVPHTFHEVRCILHPCAPMMYSSKAYCMSLDLGIIYILSEVPVTIEFPLSRSMTE